MIAMESNDILSASQSFWKILCTSLAYCNKLETYTQLQGQTWSLKTEALMKNDSFV
jgi:hypothetical protein